MSVSITVSDQIFNMNKRLLFIRLSVYECVFQYTSAAYICILGVKQIQRKIYYYAVLYILCYIIL